MLGDGVVAPLMEVVHRLADARQLVVDIQRSEDQDVAHLERCLDRAGADIVARVIDDEDRVDLRLADDSPCDFLAVAHLLGYAVGNDELDVELVRAKRGAEVGEGIDPLVLDELFHLSNRHRFVTVDIQPLGQGSAVRVVVDSCDYPLYDPPEGDREEGGKR